MKLRLALLIVAVVFALSVIPVGAQNAVRLDRPADGAPLQRIAKHLGLTQQQVEQIARIAKQYYGDVKAVMQSDIPKEQKKDRGATLKRQASEAVTAILTPEQREKAAKMRLVERLLSPRAAHKAGMFWALKQLDLTEAQRTQIKGILQQAREKANAVRADTALDDAAKRARLLELKKQTTDQVISVLTPEQQEKLKQLKQKQGPRPGGKTTGDGVRKTR